MLGVGVGEREGAGGQGNVFATSCSPPIFDPTTAAPLPLSRSSHHPSCSEDICVYTLLNLPPDGAGHFFRAPFVNTVPLFPIPAESLQRDEREKKTCAIPHTFAERKREAGAM